MTKKQLERELESVKIKNKQMNEAIGFILNICLLWEKRDVGSYKAVKLINEIFVKKEESKNVNES